MNNSLCFDMIAKVAVDKTLYSFDDEFDYRIPSKFSGKIIPGCRVLVPFGRSNQLRQAVVLSITNQQDVSKIKPINAVLDMAPLLSSEMIKLAFFMKQRYYCTLFDAFRVMIPSGFNIKLRGYYTLNPNQRSKNIQFTEKQLKIIKAFDNIHVYEESLNNVVCDEDRDELENLISNNVIVYLYEQKKSVQDATVKMVCPVENVEISSLKLTDKQIRVYDFLLKSGGVSLKELSYFLGVSASVVDNLVKKGAAKYFEDEVFRDPYKGVNFERDNSKINLTLEQKKASDSLYSKYLEDKPFVSLLYGITGSGKTSVFMDLIDKVINDNDGIIVMVPEISLTPQLMVSFRCRYGEKVAIFHSSLSNGERLDEFKRVERGDVKIVVGTRSAVFAPFKRVRLIIMDEEHEYTYKSESTPRYDAKDIAKFRCNYSNGLLLLSSATPSIESYYMVKCGRYQIDKLSKRYGNASLPEVKIVDMNKEVDSGNMSIFSGELLASLKKI